LKARLADVFEKAKATAAASARTLPINGRDGEYDIDRTYINYRWFERRQPKIRTATMNATKLASKSDARNEGSKMSGRPKLSFSHMGIFVTDINKMVVFIRGFLVWWLATETL
jgi:hypothetical protein